MATRYTVDHRGLPNNPITALLVDSSLPPSHLLFKHARLRYALRIACASPTTSPAAAAQPRRFPSAIARRDSFTGRHAVPIRELGNGAPSEVGGAPSYTLMPQLSLLNVFDEVT